MNAGRWLLGAATWLGAALAIIAVGALAVHEQQEAEDAIEVRCQQGGGVEWEFSEGRHICKDANGLPVKVD